MQQLNKEEIKRLIPLYSGHIVQELEYAYSEEAPFGKVDMQVHVDRADNPNTILILGGFAGTALYGDSENKEINQRIKMLILDFFNRDGNNEKEIWLSLYSSNWESKIDELFVENEKRKDNRLIHRLNLDKFSPHKNWQERVPSGYTVVKYDTSSTMFLDKRNWRDFWHPKSERFGWFLMKDGEAISECWSVWIEKIGVEKSCVEISVDTKEEFRRNGYAVITSAAFIEDCLSRNLIPVWCCWQSTKGSMKLAEKLGFDVIENRRAIFIKP